MSRGSGGLRVVWSGLTNPAFSGVVATGGITLLVGGLTVHSTALNAVGGAITGIGVLFLLAGLVPRWGGGDAGGDGSGGGKGPGRREDQAGNGDLAKAIEEANRANKLLEDDLYPGSGAQGEK